MPMRIASQFTLFLSSDSTETCSPASHLFANGMPTGKSIQGAVLEAVVEWNSQYLMFVTDDIPYEESLHIVLLDAAFEVIDSASIEAPYTTGSFSSLALHEPDTVEFRFLGETTWTLRLLASSALRLPFVSEPFGVHRRFGFRRRFILHRMPAAGA